MLISLPDGEVGFISLSIDCTKPELILLDLNRIVLGLLLFEVMVEVELAVVRLSSSSSLRPRRLASAPDSLAAAVCSRIYDSIMLIRSLFDRRFESRSSSSSYEYNMVDVAGSLLL